MDDSLASGQDRPPGLCATCRHRRVVTSDRGSRFVLCEKSKTDPSFPKFPRLPVVVCAGYEKGSQV